MRVSRLVAIALSLLPAAAAAQTVAIEAASPTSFTLVDGSPQTIGVRVTVDGTAVQFPPVQWTVVPGAGGASASVLHVSSPLELDGYSLVQVTVAGAKGGYQITASVPVPGLPPVTFAVVNAGGPVRELAVIGGGHQSTAVATPFPEPLVVEARDFAGDPVAGAPITFTSAASGPSATVGGPVTTDAAGRASVTATATALAGLHTVFATTGSGGGLVGSPGIRLSNLTAIPASILYVSGTAQTLVIGGNTASLRVRVHDASGADVSNVAVQFSGPASGPGLGVLSAFGDGVFAIPGGGRMFTSSVGATLGISANAEPGTYDVVASVAGVASTVRFTVTNVMPAIGAIRPNGRPEADLRGSEAAVGARFQSFAFQVVDTQDHPMAGVPVTLTAPLTEPTVVLDDSVIVTDEAGFARTSGTASAAAGFYRLRADAPGAPAPVSMLMLNRPVGYRPGEPLADAPATDQTGAARTLRGLLRPGRYLVLDVCANWCPACRAVAPQIPSTLATLAAAGIGVDLVPVLREGPTVGAASTQADAVAWLQDFSLPGVALHTNGDARSPLASAADLKLGAVSPAFPTYLLVAPDGTILDRHVGALDGPGMIAFVQAQVPVTFSVAPMTVLESAGTALVTVSRTPAAGAASVAVSTVPGTAGAGDYTATQATATFAPGQATATVSVPILDDPMDEPAEQFTVVLSNPQGGTIAQGTAAITIADDDPAPVVSIADQRYQEGTGTALPAAFPVTLDRPSASPVVVTYTIVAGTATAADVTLASGTVTVRPGTLAQSIALAIVPDRVIETKETFTVHLSAATAARIAVTDAVVTIVDDDVDTAPPVIQTVADVVIEVKMATTAQTLVSYPLPLAKDARDGAVPVVCTPVSGSKLGYGVWPVTCVAEDRAGNQARSGFSLVVRPPTIAGALFDPERPSAPLSEVRAGGEVRVHVDAGAFASRSRVVLTFVDAAGRRFDLEQAKAAIDGALDAVIEIPGAAAEGLGQVLADGVNATGPYNRGWFLTVLPRSRW